jgi:hypothetical protein
VPVHRLSYCVNLEALELQEKPYKSLEHLLASQTGLSNVKWICL